MLSSMEDDQHSRLYPCDRLIEIDGVNVENATRDDIVSRIKNAGAHVTLLVQSTNEMDRSSGR